MTCGRYLSSCILITCGLMQNDQRVREVLDFFAFHSFTGIPGRHLRLIYQVCIVTCMATVKADFWLPQQSFSEFTAPAKC